MSINSPDSKVGPTKPLELEQIKSECRNLVRRGLRSTAIALWQSRTGDDAGTARKQIDHLFD